MPSKQKQLSFRLSYEEYKRFLRYKQDSPFKFDNGAAKQLFLDGLIGYELTLQDRCVTCGRTFCFCEKE